MSTTRGIVVVGSGQGGVQLADSLRGEGYTGPIDLFGTEVHLPPHLSAQLTAAVKPGDEVTVQGLRARAMPVVIAHSITDDASSQTVTDPGPGAGPGARDGGQMLEDQGKVKQQLHGPRGDVNGVLLEDGTIVRMPPPEAQRLAGELAAGHGAA